MEKLGRPIQLIRRPFFELSNPCLPLKQSHLNDGLQKLDTSVFKEIEDPELASKRPRAIYKAKGYPDDWIEKRMRGIAICG